VDRWEEGEMRLSYSSFTPLPVAADEVTEKKEMGQEKEMGQAYIARSKL